MSLGFWNSEGRHRIIKLQSVLLSLVLCSAFFAVSAKAAAAKSTGGEEGSFANLSQSVPYSVHGVAQLNGTSPAESNTPSQASTTPGAESLALFLAGCLSLLAYAGVRRIHSHSHRHKQIH